MSAPTDVIVSISINWDPEVEKKFVDDVQTWVESHGHQKFEIADAGGEKMLCSTLLIGSFKNFETEKFLNWIKLSGLYDPTHEHSQIEVMIKDNKEDFATWKVRA